MEKAFAMIFEAANRPFVGQSVDLPALEPGQVLVKNTYSTICASDLHSYYGRRSAHTHSILGHEILGEVINLPPKGVDDFYGEPIKIGDRITWSVYSYDANCAMAKKGIPQKSKSLYKYGHETVDKRNSLNGGFATHCLLLEGTSIFKLPSTIDNKTAAPLNCTHSTISGALRMAGDVSGKNVLVSGSGMLGLSACAMSHAKAANKVWALDINEQRLDVASKFGASHVFSATTPNQKILKTTERFGGVDIAIETSGDPAAIEKAIDLLSIGGHLILVGSVFCQRNISINAEKVVRNLLTIKGLHNYIPADLGHAIEFFSSHASNYPFAQLVGKEYPLYKLKEAFDYGNSGQYYRIGINPLMDDNLEEFL